MSSSSPSVANLTVNHSSLFKTFYCVKADCASSHLFIKRQQGREKEITNVKHRWDGETRLAKDRASSPTAVLQCALFHTPCKLLRAAHSHFHHSFTSRSTRLLELSTEGEGLKMPFKPCMALCTTWLQQSALASKTTVSFSIKY